MVADSGYYDRLLGEAAKSKVFMNNNYGMIEFLNSLRPTDSKSHNNVLGTDLTSYGIDFDFSESHFPFYITPWTESKIKHNLRFYKSRCYIQARPPKNNHMADFNTDSLFYIFYNLPGDILHGYSAIELYNSNWLFNTHYKLWLTNKHPNVNIGIPTSQPSPQMYMWTYFDPYQWDFKLFPGIINKQHFLTLDELRLSLFMNNDDTPKANGQIPLNFQMNSDNKF